MNYTGEAQGAVGAQRGRVLILEWVKDHKEPSEDTLAPSLGMSMGFSGKPGERGILQEERRACFFFFFSPGDLPNPGIEPGSPAFAGAFFIIEPSGKPKSMFFDE